MSRFEARLARLEAAIPVPVATHKQPVGRLQFKLDEIIANIERFKKLTAKEQVAELRADLRAHQAKLLEPEPRGFLAGKLIKLDFTDVIAERLRAAETALLAELGHPEAQHPLSAELREAVDLEMFDA